MRETMSMEDLKQAGMLREAELNRPKKALRAERESLASVLRMFFRTPENPD